MTLIQRCLNVDATSCRCIDVEPTLYKRHVPTGYSLIRNFDILRCSIVPNDWIADIEGPDQTA